jgi:hypothetical protein
MANTIFLRCNCYVGVTVIWKSVNIFVIPGASELAPDNVESVSTFGGCVSRGSIGSRFVEKYTLLIGHMRDKGLNSVVVSKKLTFASLTYSID